MASNVALVLYDSVLFNRGGAPGEITAWAMRLESRFTRYAKQEAPARSGELKAGIHGHVARVGSHQLLTTIRSEAPHSLYVLRGTNGPIMSNKGWFYYNTGIEPGKDEPKGMMRLRPGNGYGQLYRREVSGQTANPFFARAAERTARRHTSLRGFYPGVIGGFTV